MFQIIFKTGNLSVGSIQGFMPTGWKIEQTQFGLKIRDCQTEEEAGRIQLGEGQFTIVASSDDPVSVKFWHDFGKKYSILNPFDLRFGVVYQMDGCTDWELDEYPARSPQEVQEEVARYAQAKARYVSFFLGDWHFQQQLKTKSCQPILSDGSLGKDEGRCVFPLGSIENLDTM